MDWLFGVRDLPPEPVPPPAGELSRREERELQVTKRIEANLARVREELKTIIEIDAADAGHRQPR